MHSRAAFVFRFLSGDDRFGDGIDDGIGIAFALFQFLFHLGNTLFVVFDIAFKVLDAGFKRVFE